MVIIGEIHSIEWKNEKPWDVAVFVHENGYIETHDVDFCKRDNQLYYHWSGGKPSDDERTGLEILPDIKTFDDLVQHFHMIEAETEYCKQCDDHLPTDRLCEHIYWDEDECWWKERELPPTDALPIEPTGKDGED